MHPIKLTTCLGRVFICERTRVFFTITRLFTIVESSIGRIIRGSKRNDFSNNVKFEIPSFISLNHSPLEFSAWKCSRKKHYYIFNNFKTEWYRLLKCKNSSQVFQDKVIFSSSSRTKRQFYKKDYKRTSPSRHVVLIWVVIGCCLCCCVRYCWVSIWVINTITIIIGCCLCCCLKYCWAFFNNLLTLCQFKSFQKKKQ